MEQISTEKKMELIRSIRAENERNKSILHSTTSEKIPDTQTIPSFTGLKIRFFLAAVLFMGFFILDNSKVSWNGITSEVVLGELNKSISSNVFDLIAKFPYTLMDEDSKHE